MQTVLGFLFDFKSNAGKTFKKVRAEIIKTTKDWGKQFKKLSSSMSKGWKMVGLHTRKALGEFILFADKIKKTAPSITDIIGSIGDTFGGVAGIIADTLLRPGALVAGGLAVAGRSAASFSDALTETRRETMLTDEEMSRLGDSIKDISAAMRAPLTQVQSLAKRFASANIPLEEFNDLMTTAISMNRLTGLETGQYAEEIQNMRIQLGMGSKDIRDFYNTLYASNKVTEASQAQVSQMVPFIISQVQDNLPKELHKIGMESGVILASGLAGALGDRAPEVMNKFFSVVTDRSNEGRYRLAAVAEGLGNEFSSQFTTALDSGDLSKAFQAFQKGLKNLDMNQMLGIKGAMGDVFEFDVSTLKKIANVNTNYMQMAESSAKIAKSQDMILKDGKGLLTTTQRWHKLWGDIERILLPFGEIIVDGLIKAADWLGKIMKPIVDFVNKLDESTKKAFLLGAALVSAGLWMKPLVGIGLQVVNVFTSMGMQVYKVVGAIKVMTASMWGSAKAAYKSGGIMAVAWSGVTWSIRGAWAAAMGFIGSIAAVLWPVLLIVAAGAALYEIFKMAFSPKMIEFFAKALKVVLKVVTSILWGLSGIVAAFADLGSWLSGGPTDNLSHWWNSAPWKDTPEQNPAQKSSGQVISNSYETNSFTETVSPEGSFQVSEPMQDLRTSDLVSAQKENTAATYEAAEMIIKALQSILSGDGSTSFRGATGYPRHLPVPEASNLGGPR